jgi:hypothetical protein
MSAGRIAVVALTAGLSRPAEAKLFQLYVQGQGGYAAGTGNENVIVVAGNPVSQRQDVYDLIGGGAAGAELGVTLIGIDLCADFLQFMDGSGATGTVTKVVLGVRPTFKLGDDFNMFFRIGGGGMFATFGGTSPFAVDVSKNPAGLTARGGLGVSYDLGGPFEIGPQFDIGYYYLYNGSIAPDEATLRNQVEQANCSTGDQACVQRAVTNLATTQGAGFETSSGIDWNVLFALRAAFGF